MAAIMWKNGVIDWGAFGRNGKVKTAGIQIFPSIDERLNIRVITSTKSVSSAVNICIPMEDREAVARAIYPEGFNNG